MAWCCPAPPWPALSAATATSAPCGSDATANAAGSKRRALRRHGGCCAACPGVSRMMTDLNHQISTFVVREAERTGRGVALEDLQGIRGRVRAHRLQRRTLHNWASRPADHLHSLQSRPRRSRLRAGRPRLHLAGVSGVRVRGQGEQAGAGPVRLQKVWPRWARRPHRGPQHRHRRRRRLGCHQPATSYGPPFSQTGPREQTTDNWR